MNIYILFYERVPLRYLSFSINKKSCSNNVFHLSNEINNATYSLYPFMAVDKASDGHGCRCATFAGSAVEHKCRAVLIRVDFIHFVHQRHNVVKVLNKKNKIV